MAADGTTGKITIGTIGISPNIPMILFSPRTYALVSLFNFGMHSGEWKYFAF